MFAEGRLDFAEFDTMAADFYLMVETSGVFQIPVRLPARQITGAIETIARPAKWIRHEPLRGQTRTAKIATCQAKAADIKFSFNPNRNRLQESIQNDRSALRQSGAR